jgi:hypothetical protein
MLTFAPGQHCQQDCRRIGMHSALLILQCIVLLVCFAALYIYVTIHAVGRHPAWIIMLTWCASAGGD